MCKRYTGCTACWQIVYCLSCVPAMSPAGAPRVMASRSSMCQMLSANPRWLVEQRNTQLAVLLQHQS